MRAASSSRARSTDPRDYQRVARPFAAMAKRFTDGFEIEPHSHPRDQLIYAVSGLMRVRTERNAWIVPPDRAVYLPARTIHSISMRGDVEMRTLYVARDAAGVAFSGEVASGSPQKTRQLKDILPGGPTVMAVSRLLRELVLALVDEPLLYDQAGRGGAIVSLIVSEIARAPRLPLVIPMPRDPRLRRVCARLLADPSDLRTLDGWSRDCGRLRTHARAPVRQRAGSHLHGVAPARALSQRAGSDRPGRADRAHRAPQWLPQPERICGRVPVRHGTCADRSCPSRSPLTGIGWRESCCWFIGP